MKKYNTFITTSLILGMFITGCGTPATTPSPSPSTGTSATANSENYKVIKTINVGKTPHGMWQASGFVYNSNIGEGTISVIDTKTDAIVKTIKIDDGVPGYVKAFHDDKNILVTDTKKGELLVIDPAQDHKIIQTIKLGKSPDKIKISEDDKTVFVSLVGEDKVIALTFDTDRSKEVVRKEYKIGTMTEGSEHRTLGITNDWLVVPNIGDNDVSLINLASGTEKRLKDGNNPAVVALGNTDNKAKSVIVGNSSSNTVTLFDINSDNKKTLSDVGLTATDIAVVDNLNRAFITMSGSNEVAVIDYNKQTVVGKIPVGSRPVHIYTVSDSDDEFTVKHDGEEHEKSTTELWIGNDAGDSVSVINPETLEVKATIKTGKGHHKMAFSKDKAYISNITDNTVTVIQRNK